MTAAVDLGQRPLNEATFVCAHIVETLRDGVARGFHWSVSDDDCCATCSTCNALSDAEWDSVAAEVGKLISFHNFVEAARLNGVSIKESD